MSFFLFMTGKRGFSFAPKSKSVQEIEDDFEGVKVFVSFCLHAVAGFCVLICIGIFYVSKRLTTTVLVAVLAFVFFFNFVAAVLLFIYNGSVNQDRTAIKDCGYLSMVLAVFVVAVGIFFAKRPPSDELEQKRRGPEAIPLQFGNIGAQPAAPAQDYFDPPPPR